MITPWRYSERDSVSNHRRLYCLLNRLLRRRSKKISKLRAIGLCEGNPPLTDWFPWKVTSDVKHGSIWWCHHECLYEMDTCSNRKGKVNWETCREQRNLTTAYFSERCDGGPKKQTFWKTIKPFITDKNAFHNNKIILQEGDQIITDTQEICEIFNAFFTSVANDIGFDDTIPPHYYTAEGFSFLSFNGIVATHVHSCVLWFMN